MSEQRDSERIGAGIRAAAENVRAPEGLRERIVAGPPDRGGSGDTGSVARGGRRRLLVLAPLAGAAAVAALVVVLLVGGGSAPSLGEAASAALREPTEPAPARDPRDAKLVRAEIGGVQFPNYTWYAKRWTTVGARRDELSGRDALTLVYSAGGRRVGYTIVDGEPLEVPAGARRLSREGMDFAVLRRGGALVLTWRQGGHTCVLASRELDVDELVAFATWS